MYVKFARQQANMVTHALARAATSYASPIIHHIAPSCIESFIINDMR